METTTKFIKRFYETPRAQEIYTSLRQRSKAVQRAINDEVCVEDIPDEITKLDKVRSLSTNEKVIDFPLDERNQEIEFDESLCNCDEPTIPETLLSECESKVSEIYNTILQDQKQRELLNWSLKVVNDREIIVEGQRSGDPSDISWKTSVICERISTNVVRSKKGTLYFLLGEINANDMIEKSFSEEIVSMFKYGFPPNWGDIFSKIVSDQPER
ncbi:Hypothetical predicted protein [Paramuricea clavata]|uniref:Uncharacterized protein n=1 Tax=Paramuricea clavata TaxID=317549 RepID=A0A7D9L1N6_PARCT|nr:Hypothetical predicted protein [Paramuricea clavata]